ncbi:MAG: NAD(P)-binding protein [Ignavibacteria bacterium]|nr:NAD(P)-binding protein [Ignavibacteria bacterium]
MKKAIVCGAGIGGMVSAIYLSQKGYEVEIFEKNSKPGGKMSELRRDGYRFDTGPSLITLPEILDNFFKDIGRDMKDYFELIELESSAKYFWNDGTVFNSFINESKLNEELDEVFGEKEKDNFFRFLKYGRLFYDLSEDNFLKNEFKIRNYITREGLKNFTKFISGRSMNDVSNKFFKNAKLKQLLDRFATYNGSSPFLAPQFFSIIPYVEYEFGAWFVKGGIYEIANALEKVCSEMNIGINYGHKLIDFETANKKITGLIFEGEKRSSTMKKILTF